MPPRQMNMLPDTDELSASIAAALGFSSRAAFAAAFRKLTGRPRAIAGGAFNSSNRSTPTAIALAQR